jgi:hypothetical protein
MDAHSSVWVSPRASGCKAHADAGKRYHAFQLDAAERERLHPSVDDRCRIASADMFKKASLEAQKLLAGKLAPAACVAEQMYQPRR